MIKYRIHTPSKTAYYETLKRLMSHGYCYGLYRAKTVASVKRRSNATYSWILIGHFRECSMQLNACTDAFFHRMQYQEISLDDFLALPD